ncbi:hypothetical protein KAX22_04280, partial [bacterium]|nr:hypothetical protein [bacterium]
MKICVLSEELANPLDEGIKKFSYSLIKALSTQHYVLGLSKWGLFEEWCRVEKVPMNKLLLNWGLWRKIRRFAPQVICYAPSSSGSFFGFLRGRILKWYRRRARLVLISLQPKSFSPFLARLVRYLRPDMILVQSEKSASFLEELGCSARIFSSGVEMEKFAPVSEIRKQQLRRRHGLPSKTFLVLHVGHINPDRGVALFRDLQEKPGIQTLLVGSTSTLQDEGLARDLEDAGVRVMRDYIPGIQEIYQLS